jgi:hypothetical protein
LVSVQLFMSSFGDETFVRWGEWNILKEK